MFGVFLTVVVLSLAGSPKADPFIFSISRDFRSTEALEENLWSLVNVTKKSECFQVEFKIPLSLSFSDVFVFFANDTKAILKVALTDKTQGTYYTIPYKAVKNMEGKDTTVERDEKFQIVNGEIPINWMPENITKVSATVVGVDEVYYNYYGVQNYPISFYDLMLVEEYKNYTVT